MVLSFIWLNAADEPMIQGIIKCICLSPTHPSQAPTATCHPISTCLTTPPQLDKHHCTIYCCRPTMVRGQSTWRKKKNWRHWFCSACRRDPPSPIAMFNYLKGDCRENKVKLVSDVHTDRTKGSNHELQQVKFPLTVALEELLREDFESPSLEIFQIGLGKALSNLIQV